MEGVGPFDGYLVNLPAIWHSLWPFGIVLPVFWQTCYPMQICAQSRFFAQMLSKAIETKCEKDFSVAFGDNNLAKIFSTSRPPT
jgi:hypothetical protein